MNNNTGEGLPKLELKFTDTLKKEVPIYIQLGLIDWKDDNYVHRLNQGEATAMSLLDEARAHALQTLLERAQAAHQKDPNSLSQLSELDRQRLLSIPQLIASKQASLAHINELYRIYQDMIATPEERLAKLNMLGQNIVNTAALQVAQGTMSQHDLQTLGTNVERVLADFKAHQKYQEALAELQKLSDSTTA